MCFPGEQSFNYSGTLYSLPKRVVYENLNFTGENSAQYYEFVADNQQEFLRKTNPNLWDQLV
jgi:hypothetical protein